MKRRTSGRNELKGNIGGRADETGSADGFARPF